MNGLKFNQARLIPNLLVVTTLLFGLLGTSSQAHGKTCPRPSTYRDSIQFFKEVIEKNRKENERDLQVIRDQLAPEAEKWLYQLKKDQIASGAIMQALEVLSIVSSYLEDSLEFNAEIQAALAQLKSTFDPKIRVSEQLNEIAKDPKLKSVEGKLTNLAKAVLLLETTTSDWQIAESEIIQRFLKGQSLTESLFLEISQRTEKLNSDLSEILNVEQIDQGFADRAVAQLQDAEKRVANRERGIQNLRGQISILEEKIKAGIREPFEPTACPGQHER